MTVSVEKTGKESYLQQVVKLVEEAQESKSRTQDLSNRAAKWLFYIALASGFATLFIWSLAGYSFPYALERMVTVMVIACPHALGLAAPLVVAVSTSLSAKKGLLIRDRASFESARLLNAVVFDKTGTLTKGTFGVTDVVPEEGKNEADLLKWAAALESQSDHPLAAGVVEEAKMKELDFFQPDEFKSLTGQGLTGRVNGASVQVVSPGYVKEKKMNYDEDTFAKLSKQGKTVIFVIVNDELFGMIGLADQIRDSSQQAIQSLNKRDIEAMMLTGDNRRVAEWVGKQLNLDQVYAEVLPHEKADYIKDIQSKGKKVAMTGDGVNDAPALATADLGIAIGAGTDVAVSSADVVLVRSNPQDVVAIIELSRATYRKMIQNLWWAAGYNIFAIPLAAGILAPVGIVLSPAIGAVLMSISTIVVAINAKLLKA